MAQKSIKAKRRFFDNFSTSITKLAGKPGAFLLALSLIIAWAITGPVFKFSDTWQLVINTSTTIITFLMVFVIQQTQNKDTMAMQLKLNELIACNQKASNKLIDIEDLTEGEIETIKKFYIQLATMAKKEGVLATHSYSEAELNHSEKAKKHK